MEKYTFKQLTSNILYKTFGLRQVKYNETLANLLISSKDKEITVSEQDLLSRLQEKIRRRGSSWNEYELEEWFIGPIISLIDIEAEYISTFAQREMSVQVGDYELSGRPDMLIASGIDSPQVPYFCIQEYKPQTDPKGNPLPQLLGAMLAAQVLNGNGKQVYGVYIVGNDWQFVVLSGNEWSETKKYIADDDELFDIFKILKALKEIILSY